MPDIGWSRVLNSRPVLSRGSGSKPRPVQRTRRSLLNAGSWPVVSCRCKWLTCDSETSCHKSICRNRNDDPVKYIAWLRYFLNDNSILVIPKKWRFIFVSNTFQLYLDDKKWICLRCFRKMSTVKKLHYSVSVLSVLV